MFLVLFLTVSAAGWAADTGRLKTEVQPGSAGVFMDGKYVGPARNFSHGQTYELPTGEHEIWITEPRHEDIQTEVNIKAGQTTEFKQTMKALPKPQPPFGKLRTKNSDHFAAVYVNNRYMGYVGEFSNFMQGLPLNPGTYQVKIAPRTGSPITRTVTIAAGKTVLVK